MLIWHHVPGRFCICQSLNKWGEPRVKIQHHECLAEGLQNTCLPRPFLLKVRTVNQKRVFTLLYNEVLNLVVMAIFLRVPVSNSPEFQSAEGQDPENSKPEEMRLLGCRDPYDALSLN